MSLAIRTALWIQIGLALFWNFAYLTVSNANWGILLYFFVVFIAHVPLVLFALWVFWKHPDKRRAAGWTIVIPFASLAISLTLRNLIGDALSESSLVLLFAALVLGTVAYCVARPGVAIRLLPGAMLKNRGVNLALIGLQIVAWLIPIAMFFFVIYENAGRTIKTSDVSGMGLAYAFIAVLVYVAGVGVFSLIAGIYAWLGLRGGGDGAQRRLHITQLVIAVPSLVFGLGALFMLYN